MDSNVDNWLGIVVDSLSAIGHALGVRFRGGSEHDMGDNIGPTIREALSAGKVPEEARPALWKYVRGERGKENLFSAFVACLRDRGEHTPETDFMALARVLSFRQKSNNVAAYIDVFRAKARSLAEYSFPKEVLGLCLLNGLASERIRDTALHFMNPEIGTDRLPLEEEFDLQRVAMVIRRAALHVGPVDTTATRARVVSQSQAKVSGANASQAPRGGHRFRGGNRGNGRGRGGQAGYPPLSGSNATRAYVSTITIPSLGIDGRRHDGEPSPTSALVASVSADRAFRALLASGRGAMFVIKGTLSNVPARFMLDSGAALNLMTRHLASQLPTGAIETLSQSEVAYLSDASGRPMGSVTRVGADLSVTMHELTTLLSFDVSEAMASDTYDAILGAPFFRAHGVNIGYEQNVAHARAGSLGDLLPTTVRSRLG